MSNVPLLPLELLEDDELLAELEEVFPEEVVLDDVELDEVLLVEPLEELDELPSMSPPQLANRATNANKPSVFFIVLIP